MNSVTVASACDFIRGITFKPHELIDVSDADAIVCLRTKNIQRDLDQRDLIAVPSRLVRNKEKLLRAGDLLISSANSWELVGKCSYVPELSYKATAGGFIAIVRPKAHTNPRFLYHWLNSPATQETVRNLGRQTTNISNLDVNRFKELKFPNLGYDQQRRIATILDKADAIRRKREQALALADDFLKSAFSERFGRRTWPTRTLAEVVASGTIVTYGIVQAGPEVDGGVPYIRTGDIKVGKIQLEGLRHTAPEIASRFSRSRVRSGEIVMSIRATVGTTAVVPPELDGANLTQGTARIAPGKDVTLEYLVSYLRSQDAQEWIESQVKGATFREITLARLRELPVPTPPINEQEGYSVLYKKLQKVTAGFAADLCDSNELSGGLSQRALRGEL
jgi:type I restriction enzyme S subunit